MARNGELKKSSMEITNDPKTGAHRIKVTIVSPATAAEMNFKRYKTFHKQRKNKRALG